MTRLRSIQIESFDDFEGKQLQEAPRRGRRTDDAPTKEPRQRVERERGWPGRDGSDRRSRRERAGKCEPVDS